MFIGYMDLLELTTKQLRRAAAIKEQIESLNKELQRILGASSNSDGGPTKRRAMSASVKRKIAAAQKARWARLRAAKPARRSAKRAAKT
jgi:hypothetical protein